MDLMESNSSINDYRINSNIICMIFTRTRGPIALQADYVTEQYNVRKISSPSSSLPFLAKTNAPCSTASLR